ncbi:unnamed protein product [Urochloa humidicola]
MEAQTAQPSSGSSPAAYPPWVLLVQPGMTKIEDKDKDSSSSTAESQTRVAARTSAGDPIQVYLHLAEPPALSAVVIAESPGGRHPRSTIIAAHRDSLLIQVCIEESMCGHTLDHFVYSAGDAAVDPPRPPSLWLLPPYNPTDEEEIRWSSCVDMSRDLEPKATGILRCGQDDEVVVAELQMVAESMITAEPNAAELFLFRSGRWSVKRPPIRYGKRDLGELPSLWTTDTVVAVGNQLLCWVDLSCGVLFCDVFEESPRLKFMPLPRDPCPCYGQQSNRNVCVTDGGCALKFVDIVHRCCCGGDSAIAGCHCSLDAYIINTWTMRMSDMNWVKDGMVDATELWGLDDYKSLRLARVMPTGPVVSMVEPYTIFFLLSHALYDQDGDQELWLIMVDMKSKTLTVVTQHPGGCLAMSGPTLIPSNVSYYLNSYPSSGWDDSTWTDSDLF